MMAFKQIHFAITQVLRIISKIITLFPAHKF